jgi:hypothetical protein
MIAIAIIVIIIIVFIIIQTYAMVVLDMHVHGMCATARA